MASSEWTTTPKIAALIEQLADALAEEYGGDHAYSIMARGRKIAASNMKDGWIKPLAVAPTSTNDRD